MENIKFSKKKTKALFLNLSVLFPLILNNSFLSQIIIISFFCVTALCYGNFNLNISKLIFLILILFSIVLNSSQIEFKNAMRLTQLTLGFMVFPLLINTENLNINYIRFGIVYVAVLTVLDILNLPIFFLYRDAFYPTDANPWALGFDHSIIALSNRYGSIFYNPNLLGQSMLLIYILYLIYNYQKKFTKMDYLIVFLNTFCILVSGSRTAFVIYAIVTFCFFFHFYKGKIKYFFILAGIPYALYSLSNTRLLKIGNESGDSMDLKMQILYSYFSSLSFTIQDTFLLLFGSLKLDIQFDNDLGNIIYYLGLMGLLYVICFYTYEIFTTNWRLRYFYSFLLVSYGATLLINFKFFIFAIIIFSFLRSLSKNLKKQKAAVPDTQMI